MKISAVALLLILTLPPLMEGASSSEPYGEIIDLPPFEIEGRFPWTFTRVPGYEVLSLARPRETSTIVEHFLRAIRVAPMFFPPSWETDHSEPITLFLHHFAGESTLSAVQQEQEYNFRPDSVSVVQWGDMVSLPGENVTKSWLQGRRSPLADHVVWGLILQPLDVPPWYQKGLGGLLSGASIGGSFVEIPGIRWSNDELMPLANVLATSSRAELAELERGPPKTREQFMAGAMLFVRWAFFAEEDGKRTALLTFVDQASRFPPTEEMFSHIFGLTIEEAQSELTAYARGAAQQRTSVTVPRDLLVEVPRRAEVEPASREQVARLLGRFYFLLGAVSFPDHRDEYLVKARAAYADAFPAGRNDPRLTSDLGYLDYFSGNWGEAEPRLEAALSDEVTDSRALVALARGRLKAAAANLGEGDKLSDAQNANILDPLRKAMALRPAPKEAFVIAAALWLNRDRLPPAVDLAALARGARIFHHVPQVIIPIIELHKRARQPRVASELISLLLTLPNLAEDARHALQEQQAALQRMVDVMGGNPELEAGGTGAHDPAP